MEELVEYLSDKLDRRKECEAAGYHLGETETTNEAGISVYKCRHCGDVYEKTN